MNFQNAYFYESVGLTVEEITSIPPDQIDDLAPDLQKKIVNELINKISVYFDQIKSKHTIEIEYSQHVTSILEGMCHSETESVEMTEEGDSRSVEVAMAVGSDQFTTVTNTSIPVRNHTSMELEVFAHGRITRVGSLKHTANIDGSPSYCLSFCEFFSFNIFKSMSLSGMYRDAASVGLLLIRHS